ncbi:HNH endonuclease [Sporosarcina sp. resist]|uniref:HNH endonuclease n=1 Tax=Sporosarcina sp. resist TaxID=2762563 RepID=UPI00164E8660|nr:HNH endonuclease [Sporosarcina sp. resist]QNK87233.1 HNH endonuclease [Sporosarcina sp. resist]
MKFFRKVGQGVNLIGGGIVKGGVNVASSIVGTKFPKTGAYMKEVGDTVVHSSRTVITNTAHFADGATNGIYGSVRKDPVRMGEGWGDVKTSSVNTAKGIGGGLVYTLKSVGQTFQGVINKDGDQITEGLKNIGKVATVAVFGVGVIDLLVDTDVVQAEELETRNSYLEGSPHSGTNVPFEENSFIQKNGGMQMGVFPVFDSEFDATLPAETYLMSDTVHIGIANMQLYEAIQNNPGLADELGFDSVDIASLQLSVTPEGFDWHHHEEPGRMQLVDEGAHSQTGHTGGRTIWAGGSEAR